MAGEIGRGVFGGAVSGASSGAALGPYGMVAGAIIGGISGFMQGKNAQNLQKKYEAAEANVKTTDPMQMAYLQRLRNQERAYRAGADPSSAFAAMQARNVTAQTQANLLRAGGAGAVGNLLRAQAVGGQTMAEIGARASEGANTMMQLQGNIIDQITERNMQRQRELRDQALARAVGAQQDIRNQFQGSLAMLPGIAKGIPGLGKIAGIGGAGAGKQFFSGGMVGNKYVPGVSAGLNYQGLGNRTGISAIDNYRPNFGFNINKPISNGRR